MNTEPINPLGVKDWSVWNFFSQSMLYKTDWSWKLRTWSGRWIWLIFQQILPTTSTENRGVWLKPLLFVYFQPFSVDYLARISFSRKMTPLECMESFVLLFLVVSGEFWHDFLNVFNVEKLGGGVWKFLENWKILDFGVVRNQDIKWITSYSYR